MNITTNNQMTSTSTPGALATSALYVLLIAFSVGIAVPLSTFAATNDTTVYVPVAGLGYYVDATGKPIVSGTNQSYSCSQSVCTPITSATNNAQPLQTNGQTGFQSYAYTPFPYPSYTTPVAQPSVSFGSLPSFPFPSYATPLPQIQSQNIGPDGSVYLPYPTYGSTPVYGKIATYSYGVGSIQDSIATSLGYIPRTNSGYTGYTGNGGYPYHTTGFQYTTPYQSSNGHSGFTLIQTLN